VDFEVAFEFKSRLTGMLFEPLFAQTIGSLVEAFVQRARAQAGAS
jgi:ribosome-associated toxin RatA of RatAB toxin-antitoxin module